MDAEMDFLATRRFVDKLERVLMGTALPSEMDATTKQEAAALHNLQLHQHAQRKLQLLQALQLQRTIRSQTE